MPCEGQAIHFKAYRIKSKLFSLLYMPSKISALKKTETHKTVWKATSKCAMSAHSYIINSISKCKLVMTNLFEISYTGPRNRLYYIYI